MQHYPSTLITLIQNLAKLPGIGAKTAERLALHILRSKERDTEALARSILDIKRKIRLCRQCFSFSDGDLCKICNNPSRDASLLCVVEQQSDLVSLEKSGAFPGLYHILQGVLSPMDGIGPDNLRIRELELRVSGGVQEVVLATSTTVEGEATADYLAQRLKQFPVRVTRIASGVPVGGDLKYVDQVTLKRALNSRHDYTTE